jgi:hypothetical protein
MPTTSKQIIAEVAERISASRAQLDRSLHELRQQYGPAAVERATALVDEQRQKRDTIAVTPTLKSYRRHGE